MEISPTLDPWSVTLALLGAHFGAYAVAAGLLWWPLTGPGRARFAALRIVPELPGRAQVRREVRASLISLAIYVGVIGLSIALAAQGASRLVVDGPRVGILGHLAQGAALYLVLDAYWYLTHRMMHWPGVFRVVHAGHHALRNPSPFASYAQSIPESLINASPYLFLPLVWPLRLETILGLQAVLTVFASIGHCGYELFPEALRRRLPLCLFNSASHHAAHHLDARINFGSMTSLWDHLCGTQDARFWLRRRA